MDWDRAAACSVALPGRVVVTTTTRVFAAQMRQAPAVFYVDDLSPLGEALGRHRICLVVGEVDGDKARDFAYRLRTAGFPVVVLELPQPLVVRRRVALATAVSEGTVEIETLRGDISACFTISDKALAIGAGVLEAILTYLNQDAEALS